MRTELTVCAAILSAGLPLLAQSATAGVKARIPIDEALEEVQANSPPDNGNSSGVPSMPLRLPRRFSVHFEALYRRLGYRYDEWRMDGPIYARTAANSWELPIVMRVSLNTSRVHPFVGGGAALRLMTGIDPRRTSALVAARDPRTEFSDRADIGAVVSTGLEFKVGRMKVSPQVRYTRWRSNNLFNPLNAFLRSERNQGDFLIAFTF